MKVFDRWAVWAVAGGALLLGACGGGGGGFLPTPTSQPTRTVTFRPTPTATASREVNVTDVFPPLGNAAGSVSVLIEGAGFSEGGTNEVEFGEIPARSVITLDDRRISCMAPPGTVGSSVDVSVTNTKGTGVRSGAFRYAGGGSQTALGIELSGEPTVRFDNQIGTTTVVVDYLVRDSDGIPVDESQLNVQMFVDGVRLGAGGIFGESVLDRNSTELDLNVFVLLVLDASFSLQQFNPPQFAPMLSSAQSLVDAGTQIWRNRGGEFSWDVTWFDELISWPDPDSRNPFRIAFIPVPAPGNFTKLYGAVSSALEDSAMLYREGVAAGPRDRHAIVVFTDGQDNLSAFDNRDVRLEGRLTNGDPYPRVGWKATELEDLFAEIAAAPTYPANLSVHTIALGTSCETAPASTACFDEKALSEIAQVGFGQRLSSVGSVGSLFNQIQREFTTLQSSGARMALRAGTYQFRLVSQLSNRTASGEVSFDFRVTSNGAEFIGFR